MHLGLSILQDSKIKINEFCHDYVEPKCGERAKLYCMDTNSFIVYIKTEDIYVDISKDNETS